MVNACKWKPKLVTLADGRQVLSDSEDWRAECEARHILNMPTKAARHEQLALVEKHRGGAGRKELEDRIMELWRLGLDKGAA